jgi:Uma2 family endonuclease
MTARDIDVSKKYTFADYLTWLDDKRRELINGFVKLMSPAPSKTHQEILSGLHLHIAPYLMDKPCSVYFAPFDVRFPENDDDKSDKSIITVVQPDFIIVCDQGKLDEKGCLGAPDFIAEITSPSSLKRDIEEKYQVYEKYGVREYWVIFPETKSVNVFVLDENGKYQVGGMYASDSRIKVNIFNDLEIDLTEIFKS